MMTRRAYLSQIIGDGQSAATAFRPALYDLLPPPKPLDVMDARQDRNAAGEWVLVVADTSDETRASVSAKPGVLPLPLGPSDSETLDLATAVLASAMPSAKSASITEIVEGGGFRVAGAELTISSALKELDL